MHCTNGIVIQQSSDATESTQKIENEYSRSLVSSKQRSFKAMQNDIDPVMQKKRVNPDIMNIELKPVSERERDSRNADFFWVLLKYEAARRGLQYAIPNWTGFNCLLAKQYDTHHVVAYLPAIDQSPTKLETVKELLLQSKIKAEKLGLLATDVVLDLAIYAKAVEILNMPQHSDMKSFIVLRMGAFHTSCIFLAVIGKRFGDAGLRDVILESNLLGKIC